MDAGDWIAIYAAFLASLTLFWNIYQAWNAQKANVLITYSLVWGKFFPDTDDGLLVSTSNTGSVPITLIRYGVTGEKRGTGFEVIRHEKLPVTLNPSEVFEFTVDMEHLTATEGLKSFYVVDSSEKKWECELDYSIPAAIKEYLKSIELEKQKLLLL